MSRPVAYWRDLIAGCTVGCTPEQVDRAAAIAAATDAAGKPCGAWHAVSVVFGTTHRCPCVPCTKERAT